MFADDIIKDLYRAYQSNMHSGLICMEEFQEDVARILYISRLLRKYRNSKETNVTLLVNHIVIAFNVFGNDLSGILFRAIKDDLHPQLSAVLHTFSRLTKEEYANRKIDISLIDYIEEELESHGEESNRRLHRLRNHKASFNTV